MHCDVCASVRACLCAYRRVGNRPGVSYRACLWLSKHGMRRDISVVPGKAEMVAISLLTLLTRRLSRFLGSQQRRRIRRVNTLVSVDLPTLAFPTTYTLRPPHTCNTVSEGRGESRGGVREGGSGTRRSGTGAHLEHELCQALHAHAQHAGQQEHLRGAHLLGQQPLPKVAPQRRLVRGLQERERRGH
jgi:hypothetical protein